MKPALLVIDVQKAYYENGPVTAQSLEEAVEYINAAIEFFRKKDLPVVCIQHVGEEYGIVPGTPGFDLPENLAILPSDLHIHKTYGDSFTKTSLADDLRALDVDTVIVTGFCAEYCVLSTIRGAEGVDLKPIVLRGSLASNVPERIKFVEDISDVISYGALGKILE